MKHLQKLLSQLGFDEAEIDLYRLSLKLGPATMETLRIESKKTPLTTVAALDSLLRRGLMGQSDEDGQELFFAEHPRKLQSYIENSIIALQTEAKGLDQEIASMESETDFRQPKVRFYEGKQGLRNIQEDFLATDSESVEEIFSLFEVNKCFSKEEQERFAQRRRMKKVPARGIFCDRKDEKIADERVRVKSDEHTSVIQIPETRARFKSDILIYGNKVSFAALSGKQYGIIIESKDIADTLRELFDLAFEGAEKHNIFQ